MGFGRDGAKHCETAAVPLLDRLRAFADELPSDCAGARVGQSPALRAMLEQDGPISFLAGSILGRKCRPVRAILFDKSPAANWALGWHQDRTICVRERREVAGFRNWTIKHGLHHVEPPFPLLARMLTLRVHLDDVAPDNAPLLVARGSHRLGRVAEKGIDAAVSRCVTCACTARAGDVWVYSTPILHASDRARRPTRRRVLQVNYSADDLPGELDWLGI